MVRRSVDEAITTKGCTNDRATDGCGGQSWRAVAVGGVGGAVIGVPGLSGASQLSTLDDHRATAPATDARRRTTAAGRVGRRMVRTDAARRGGQGAATSRPSNCCTKLSDGKTTIADVAKQQNVDVQT